MPARKTPVETCLAVQPGEHVACNWDQTSSAVAASLGAALKHVHATTTSLLLEDFWPRPMLRSAAAGAGCAGNKRRRYFWGDESAARES